MKVSTIIKDSKKYIQKTQSAINRKYHFPFFPAKFSDQLHDNYCHNEERSFFATCSTCWLTYISAHAETYRTPTHLYRKTSEQRRVIITFMCVHRYSQATALIYAISLTLGLARYFHG